MTSPVWTLSPVAALIWNSLDVLADIFTFFGLVWSAKIIVPGNIYRFVNDFADCALSACPVFMPFGPRIQIRQDRGMSNPGFHICGPHLDMAEYTDPELTPMIIR